jgi:hypothetical protein
MHRVLRPDRNTAIQAKEMAGVIRDWVARALGD